MPVVAAIMDVGASGGYYAALAADQIFVHPTTITGSIGVIMVTVNAQGLLEKIGVAPLAIKSGPLKDAGSPFRGLTDEERAVFQAVIDDMYGRFVRLVAESRKIPEARVRSFADGRIYTAEQARGLGLVDRDRAISTRRSRWRSRPPALDRGAGGDVPPPPRVPRQPVLRLAAGRRARTPSLGAARRRAGRQPGSAVPLPLVALSDAGRGGRRA